MIKERPENKSDYRGERDVNTEHIVEHMTGRTHSFKEASAQGKREEGPPTKVRFVARLTTDWLAILL